MELSKYIDDTNLKADATKEDIIALCCEAKEINSASVCINPSFIELAKKELCGTDVKVCTVIGFPLGAMTKEAKIFEAIDAIKKGADEVDMVINISKLKDKEYAYVEDEINEIKKSIGTHILKVILECCLLTKEEIKTACILCLNAGADFVKTSTGFSKYGALIEDVKLMRETVGNKMGVKAAGGIRDKQTMLDMINAGANRIGASHGKNLLK